MRASGFWNDMVIERHEVGPPCITDGDAAPAIILVPVVLRVQAPRLQLRPRAIFLRSAVVLTAGVAVCRDDFAMPASATPCAPGEQRSGIRRDGVAAVALPSPSRLTIRTRLRAGKDHKTIKASSCQVVSQDSVAVAIPAPATLHMTVSQMIPSDGRFCSAVAQAAPPHDRFLSSAAVGYAPQHNEPSEALPSVVDKWRHGCRGSI